MKTFKNILFTTLLFGHFCIAADTQDNKSHNYVIKFTEKGLLNYSGDIENLAATSPNKTGSTKFSAKTIASKQYSAFLTNKKDSRMAQIKSIIGNTNKNIYHYKAMYHGLMIRITESQAQLLLELPYVKSVDKEPIRQLNTDIGPQWINADQIWNGDAAPFSHFGNKGEGILIGVIDSGINPDHPSFAEVGPVDGYQHINPFGQGNFVGHCVGGNNDGIPAPNAEVVCNNKLVGAWGFTTKEDLNAPLDDSGHGTHTASTAAGNTWNGPFYNSNANQNSVIDQISGVAPHANIIAYDVCESPSCASVSAGIDRAIIDGVDVINYSISGGREPWSNFSSDRHFLDAVNAGIFVAVSAGNTRSENVNPIADTNHLGPWLMTVAASTHNRNGFRGVGQFVGGDSELGTISGRSFSSGYGSAPIVYAGNYSNGDTNPEQCLTPFPADTWTNGEIVLCDRGEIARVLKGTHVLAGGANGMILGNISSGSQNIVPDYHVLPAIHITADKANELRTWLETGTDHLGKIVVSNVDNIQIGDVLAGFSLRGPNLIFDVTKPNITAPGVGIIAAYADNPNTLDGSAEFGVLNGTSMSSPHMAGAGALIKFIHPNWTVAEINSAIQMTADQTGRKENNVTPVDADDVGQGRVDLSKAALAGLVMDETFENYINANPETGGDPKLLNLASVRNSFCGKSCTWSRELTNKLSSNTNWQVSVATDGTFDLSVAPLEFSISPDRIFINGFDESILTEVITQIIEITASKVPETAQGMSFGTITLTETNGKSPDLHITVAVNQSLPYGGEAPADDK